MASYRGLSSPLLGRDLTQISPVTLGSDFMPGNQLPVPSGGSSLPTIVRDIGGVIGGILGGLPIGGILGQGGLSSSPAPTVPKINIPTYAMTVHGGGRRRMNVLNAKALRRSMRRVEGFARFSRKCISFTKRVHMKKGCRRK